MNLISGFFINIVMAKRGTKRKVYDKKIILSLVVGLIVIAVVAIYFTQNRSLTQNPNYNPNANLRSCDNLQIVVNSMREASAYYRYGYIKVAPTSYKFEILDLTVTNTGSYQGDFSGYRLALNASDGSSAIPVQFFSFEKMVLLDNSTFDFSCNETNLASSSRFVLNSGQSSNGCKIFSILSGSSPSFLSVYNVSGLKCIISLG